jgi:hypothetical protein
MGQSGKHMEPLEGRRLFASPQVVVHVRGQPRRSADHLRSAARPGDREHAQRVHVPPGADGAFATADDIKITGASS